MLFLHITVEISLNNEILWHRCWYHIIWDYSKGAVQEHIRFDELSQCSWYQDLGTKILATGTARLINIWHGHGTEIFGTARIHQILARHGTGRP